MSLSNIDQFVSKFLSVPPCSDPELLDQVLQPSLDAENRLRRAFSSARDDPRLTDLHIGLMNVFALPPVMRLTKSRHGYGADSADPLWRKGHIFPLRSDKRRSDASPAVVSSIEDFETNFQIFTSGMFRELDWTNIVVAGGAVLACLSPPPSNFVENNLLGEYFHDTAYRSSDLDIFIYGLCDAEAKAKMLQIYLSIKKVLSFRVLCIRKKNTISIVSQYPYRHVQVILRLYMSPGEILAGFDVDCSCVLYDGSSVYANPRAIVALVRQANTVDLSRRSPSYEHRLYKYSKRGFEVRLRGLNRGLVRESIYDQDMPSPMPKGLARLLVLEHISLGGSYWNFESPRARKLEGNERSPWSLAAMVLSLDAACATSWYDSGLLRIPYGGRWKAKSIEKLLDNMEARLNYLSGFDRQGNRTVPEYLIGHHHNIFYGTMAECIGNICPECPATYIPRHDYRFGDTVQGPLKFITNNPGQQLMTGSFNPVSALAWEEEAYRPEEFELPFMDVWHL